MWRAQAATILKAFWCRAGVPLGAALLLAGCAALRDAPRLGYQCPNDLRFEVRLYEDMAMVEGQRGFARLQRQPDGPNGVLRYRDETLLAEFGLGLNGRLAALHYANIPEPVTCERVPARDEALGAAAVPVRAAPRAAPTLPPPPPDPNAPVRTNIRFGDTSVGPG